MWDEENEEKEGLGQNLVEKGKQKGQEAIQKGVKKGVEKIGKKVGKKATQEVTKQALSKAALAGPLGYILLWAIIVIFIIIVVVGIVMFVVTMPGMVMDKLKELGRVIGNAIASCFGADDTELSVTEENEFAVLKYLQDMGYDLAGEGFLTKIYDENDVTLLYDENEAKKVKADGGIIKDKDGNIEKADSFVIYNYLVSDNYVYTVSNFNMVTDDSNGYQWWDALEAVWVNVLSIFSTDATEAWGKGLISLYIEGNDIGEKGEYYDNDFFGWEDISIDANAKTMSIRRGWGSNKMVYSLDGWTGRYGMPLEFLLSVHLSTKMPDLAYDMTRAFGTGQNEGGEDEGIEVEILLHELEDVEAVSAYKAEDWGPNEYITYSRFNELKGEGWIFTDSWFLSKEEGFNILKEGIQSPENCTYTAQTYVLETATDNGDSGVFDTDYASELWTYGVSYDELGTINDELKDVKIKDKNEVFHYREAMIKIVDEDAEYKDAVKSIACEYGYDKAKVAPVVSKGEPKLINGNEIIEDDTCSCVEELHKTTQVEGYVVCPDHSIPIQNESSQSDGPSTGGNIIDWDNRYCKANTYYQIEKTVTTRVWEYEYNGEDTEYTWETYRYRVYKYSDEERESGETYVASYFVDYVLRYKTDEELEADGLMEDGKIVERPVKCSDAAQEAVKGNTPETTKCCENCRRLIKRIMKLLKDGNDEDFKTYTPYISKVKGHWYRDVYFTSKGNDEFVQLDEEYEAIMGERWTLYETDEETGLYKLYKLESDGTIGEPFNGTQQEANEQGIAVTKKAKTISFNDEADELIGWNKDGSVWSAYKKNEGSVTGAWEHLYTEKDIEDEPLKGRMYYQITTQYDIAQIEEGQRKQTNPVIRDMFLNNTYFRYDGSQQTAEIIEELRAAVFGTNSEDIHYGELSEDALEKTATYNDETYKVKDFAGKVELTQNSLTAFSMLENTHTLDADYIYKDFKELVVELGYFTKEELTDETPRIFAFPVPEIGSYGFPIANLDKKENEFGTQLHSKEDYKANEKNTLKALIQQLGSEVPEEVNQQQVASVSDSRVTIGLSRNFDNPEINAISDGEKKVSEVSITEFLETTREMCEYINQEGYDYCIGMGNGNGCHHDIHGNSCSLPTTFEASKGKHNFCCATLISWALQNVKVMPDSAHLDSASLLATWISDNLDVELINANEKIQEGDILFYDAHVDMVGKEIDGGFEKYNGGHKVNKGAVEYDKNTNTCIQKITGTTPGGCGANFALRINWGNSSSSGGIFEGYEGGESVVSPVTGILLEYGTYDETIDPLTGKESRVNVDMKYNVNNQNVTTSTEEGTSSEDATQTEQGTSSEDATQTEQKDVIDKVGYAKIMILDDKTYLALESKLKSSATKALGGFTSLVDKDGNYYENKEVKQNDILYEDSDKKWSEEDITLYGYKEFAEMYSDFGVSGNIIYIDGFVCESTFKDPDAKEEVEETEVVEGEKDVKGEPLTKSSFTEDYKGTLYEKEDRFNLSSKNASNKLNNENDMKDKAPTVVKVTVDGEEKILIKEGTVIGRTMTNKELVESRGETYEAPAEPTINTETTPTTGGDTTTQLANTTPVQGNYLRIIMRDLDDTIVENVEEYMKLDEEGGTVGESNGDYSEEFLYWLGVVLEGLDLEDCINGYAVAEIIGQTEDDPDGDGTITAGPGVTNWCNELFWELGYEKYVNYIKGSNVGMNVGDQIPIDVLIDIMIAELDQNIASLESEFPDNDYDEYQVAALVSVYYNFGKFPDLLKSALKNNGDLANVWPHLSDSQAVKYPGLPKRRKGEYTMFTEKKYVNVYSDLLPELQFTTSTPFSDYLGGKDTVTY